MGKTVTSKTAETTNVETTFDHSVVEVFEWSGVDGDRGMPVERKHFYAVGNE